LLKAEVIGMIMAKVQFQLFTITISTPKSSLYVRIK